MSALSLKTDIGAAFEWDKVNQHSRDTTCWVWLFLVTQQFSLWVPDLQAMPIDYVMIRPQRFGGFDRQFERLKRLHGMGRGESSRETARVGHDHLWLF